MLTCSGGTTSVTVRSTCGNGSTTSPTPVTRARPPATQNGTSAPEAEGNGDVVDARPAQHCRGVRRSAAEPATVGDLLVEVHCRRATDGGKRLGDEVGGVRRARRWRTGRVTVMVVVAAGVIDTMSARSRVTISASMRW